MGLSLPPYQIVSISVSCKCFFSPSKKFVFYSSFFFFVNFQKFRFKYFVRNSIRIWDFSEFRITVCFFYPFEQQIEDSFHANFFFFRLLFDSSLGGTLPSELALITSLIELFVLSSWFFFNPLTNLFLTYTFLLSFHRDVSNNFLTGEVPSELGTLNQLILFVNFFHHFPPFCLLIFFFFSETGLRMSLMVLSQKSFAIVWISFRLVNINQF